MPTALGNSAATVPTSPTLAIGSIYKTLYPSIDEVLIECALLSLIPKDEKAGALTQLTIVGAQGMAGVGTTLAQAQTATRGSKPQGFVLTLGQLSGSAQVSSMALSISEHNKEGAIIDVYERAMTDSTNACFYNLAQSTYGSGDGVAATCTAISSGVITLSSKLDTVKFFEDQILVLSDGTTAVATYYGVVVGVDDDAGTLSVVEGTITAGVLSVADTSTPGTPTGWDTVIGNGTRTSLSIYGDLGSGVKPTGLAGWIPTTISANDSFFSMNRSKSPWYRGAYIDGSKGTSVKDTLVDGVVRSGRRNGYASEIFVSSLGYGYLMKELGDHIRYEEIERPVGAAVKSIMLPTAKGMAKVIDDTYCPEKVAYGLDLKTWKMYSSGPMIQMDPASVSNGMVPLASVAGLEIRTCSFAQIGTEAPYRNFRAAIPA